MKYKITIVSIWFLFALCTHALAAGEDCSNATIAIQGTNSVTTSTSGSYWYTYTMTASDKLEITSDSDLQLKVYTNNCELLWYAASGYHGNLGTSELHQGDIIYIEWILINGNDFDWVLTEKPIEQGDICSQGIEAIEGNLSTPYINNELVWYKHEMTKDGSIEINSSTELSLSLYINGCDANSPYASGYGFYTYHDLKEGDVVNISWEIQSGGEFNWSIRELGTQVGNNCEIPDMAVLGSNTLPSGLNTYYWYSYEVRNDRNLIIQANTERIVTVFNECNRDYLPDYIAEGTDSIVITDLEQGDQIFIRWPTDKDNSLSWQLSEENNVPVIEDQAFTILEDNLDNNQVGLIVAEDPDDDEIHYSFVEKNELFTIDQITGELIISNNGNLRFDLDAVLTFEVEAKDDFGGSSKALITINLIKSEINEVTSIDKVIKDDLRLYPNPSESIITLNFESAEKRVVFVIDSNGKTVITINSISPQLNVNIVSLNKGIYQIGYFENNQWVQSRFVKK